jgi:hypothetical protein
MKILIELPDETADALSEKARGIGKDRKNYIQDLLLSIATTPVIRERYALHFSTTDNSGAQGQIRRFDNDLNGTHLSSISLNSEQVSIVEQAKNLVRRNAPGDREEAIHVLKTHFNNVFEMPV